MAIAESTINLNAAACIKSATHFGYSKIYNICSGAVTEVPWGGADWALAFFLMAFGIFVIALFGFLVVMIVRG